MCQLSTQLGWKIAILMHFGAGNFVDGLFFRCEHFQSKKHILPTNGLLNNCKPQTYQKKQIHDKLYINSLSCFQMRQFGDGFDEIHSNWMKFQILNLFNSSSSVSYQFLILEIAFFQVIFMKNHLKIASFESPCY